MSNVACGAAPSSPQPGGQRCPGARRVGRSHGGTEPGSGEAGHYPGQQQPGDVRLPALHPVTVVGGRVADVVVDDLHIPRIEDTEVIERSRDHGGSFRLTLLTLQTADIAWDATAAVEQALNTAIPDDTITVTGGCRYRPLRSPSRSSATATSPRFTVQARFSGGGDADTIDHHRRSLQHLRRSRDDPRTRTHDGLWVIRWPRQHLVSSHG